MTIVIVMGGSIYVCGLRDIRLQFNQELQNVERTVASGRKKDSLAILFKENTLELTLE
jgi:hypothetical protein